MPLKRIPSLATAGGDAAWSILDTQTGTVGIKEFTTKATKDHKEETHL
jgi:hypothetical protein